MTTADAANAAPSTPAPQSPPALPPVVSDAITVIAPSARVALPAPPGLGFLREVCVDGANVWVGFASTEPGAASPWHHHGAHTTYVLPLQGEGAVEFGPNGEHRMELRADGSVFVVPPGLVHREINTGTVPNQVFLVRVGEGPAVVPADAPTAAE